MAVQLIKSGLFMALAFQILIFVVLMHLWSKDTFSLNRAGQNRPFVASEEGVDDVGKLSLRRQRGGTGTLDEERLAARNPSEDAGGRGGGGGGGGGGSGKDRILKSRLESVFFSTLDCTHNLSLSFLGLDNLTADLSLDPACPWINASTRDAKHSFVALGGELAVLKNVVLDPHKVNNASFRKGGEAISSVLRQKEDVEYFSMEPGFFSVACSSPPPAAHELFLVKPRNYRRSNHLNRWLQSLACTNTTTNTTTGKSKSTSSKEAMSRSDMIRTGYVPGVTLALQRYEYANLYHTLLDWYNAFLSVLILGIDPRAVTFLLVDGHPWGKLDPTWATLFGGRGALRAGQLSDVTEFEYMVWVPNGYHCPLYEVHRDTVPYLPQLREYFFQSYDVRQSPGPVCGQLRVLVVSRQDYLAHPRNPLGVLHRKIANEEQLRDALVQAFPSHQVRLQQLDLLPMRDQVRILARTDILVGMHGAALSYTVLLPQGGGLVELYPKYAGKTSLLFKQLARWRGVHYVQWMNQFEKRELPGWLTRIPPAVVVNLVKKVTDRICADSNKV